MEFDNDGLIASTEVNHLNGFVTNCSSTSIKQVQPNLQNDEEVEDIEDRTDKDPLVSSDVSTILGVFKDIYEQRISAVSKDDKLDRNAKNEAKLAIFQQYVQQLLEQNDTFVSTMMELEAEAQKRVKQMEKRLKSSAKTTMEAAIGIHECEKEMRRLVEERLYIESLYNDMQQHLSTIKVENGFLRDQNFNLNHDVQALLHVIHHARSTGHWEMDCVTFCEVTPEQVFGPVQSLSAIYTSESPQSDFLSYESEKKGTLNSDISSQEANNSSTSSPCMSHLVKIREKD